MSIEITIYPKEASKEALRKLLLSLGFKKIRENFLRDWPTGSIHFHWFEEKDFQSTDGVEATIFQPSANEKQKFLGGEWAVHTRTRISASSYDVAKQNSVIRIIRKNFPGNFYNDWYGRNRYSKVEPDDREPLGRGIYLNYERIVEELDKVAFALPEPKLQLNHLNKNNSLFDALSVYDPSRVIYNAIIPFLVAAMENFFGKTFEILLNYDSKAEEKFKKQKDVRLRTEYVEIQDGKITIEKIITNFYSFQDVDKMQKAYIDWLGIDMKRAFRKLKRKRFGGKIAFLDEHYLELIKRRHDLIHRFNFDASLTKEQTKSLIELTKLLMKTFIEYLETDKGMKIQPADGST